MATKGKRAPPSRKASVSSSDYPLPPLYMASDRVHKQDWESVVGWIAACLLVIVLLPIMGMLYMDVLQAKHEAKQQQEKVQKLIKQLERENKDARTNRP
jgi:uncharacterized membrane protein YdfJ with MMPL/SSD domain